MLDHLSDLESDFSRFHGVTDMLALDGPRFFRLAWRIACYGDGVMSRRIAAQNNPGTAPRPQSRATPQARPRAAGGSHLIEPSAFLATHTQVIDPAMGAVIERVRVTRPTPTPT